MDTFVGTHRLFAAFAFALVGASASTFGASRQDTRPGIIHAPPFWRSERTSVWPAQTPIRV